MALGPESVGFHAGHHGGAARDSIEISGITYDSRIVRAKQRANSAVPETKTEILTDPTTLPVLKQLPNADRVNGATLSQLKGRIDVELYWRNRSGHYEHAFHRF